MLKSRYGETATTKNKAQIIQKLSLGGMQTCLDINRPLSVKVRLY